LPDSKICHAAQNMGDPQPPGTWLSLDLGGLQASPGRYGLGGQAQRNATRLRNAQPATRAALPQDDEAEGR